MDTVPHCHSVKGLQASCHCIGKSFIDSEHGQSFPPGEPPFAAPFQFSLSLEELLAIALWRDYAIASGVASEDSLGPVLGIDARKATTAHKYARFFDFKFYV